MKQPGFLQGVLIALAFAPAAAAAFAALCLVVAPGSVLRVLIAVLGGLYVLYLLCTSAVRTGRLAVPVLWAGAAVAVWAFVPGVALYLVAHVGLLWLVRSLYHHASVLPALLDLALCALALAAALAAAYATHSVLVAVWTFFLVQAMYVVIPRLLEGRAGRRAEPTDLRFRRALRSAEAAVRRMHAAS